MAPAIARKAPYKDFLQPALHRRFSSAATILLAASYIIAIFLGHFNSYFWSWFPIGPVGFRTFFVFVSALAVIVLRISQYHVGSRASKYPLQDYLSNVASVPFFEAWLTYSISGFVFGLMYLWSLSAPSDMSWIKNGRGDRTRLNEKPVFVMFFVLVCSTLQAFMHIAMDEDKIKLGVSKPKKQNDPDKDATSPASSSSTETLLGPFVSKWLAHGLVLASTRVLTSFVLSLVLYLAIFRSVAWAWSMSFFRPFYDLPKTNILPPGFGLNYKVVMTCGSVGFCLFVIWLMGGAAFSAFMARAPLKNGKPLSSESKDPNGTLLNGLKSKKMPIRCFAFWELALVARDFEDRRKSIFEDIDRKDGPMWSHVYVLCQDVVKNIEKRIDDYGKPPPPPAGVQPEPSAVQNFHSHASVQEGAVFQPRPTSRSIKKSVEQALIHSGREGGPTPLAQLSPRAKKTLRSARDKVLTEEQQEALDPVKFYGRLRTWGAAVVQNPWAGWLFRQDFRRQFNAVVLGTPLAEVTHHVNAIDALSLLAVHSLSEDKFGNVHRDMAAIVRSFTTVIKKLEAFKESFPVHWTDVEGTKETPEVDEVLLALKTGLSTIVEEFEPYMRELRLTRTDIRLAKEAAVLPPAPTTEVHAKEAAAPQSESSKEPVEALEPPRKVEQGRRRAVDKAPEMTQVRQPRR